MGSCSESQDHRPLGHRPETPAGPAVRAAGRGEKELQLLGAGRPQREKAGAREVRGAGPPCSGEDMLSRPQDTCWGPAGREGGLPGNSGPCSAPQGLPLAPCGPSTITTSLAHTWSVTAGDLSTRGGGPSLCH